MAQFSAVRAVKAAAWIAAATVAFAALAAAGVVPVGWYGKYPLPIRPNYEELWGPIFSAAIVAAALAAAHLKPPKSRSERAVLLVIVMLGGFMHLFGLILISRAGLKEPAWVSRLDWAGGYFNDALRLKDEPDVMRRYAELRPRLSLHGRAHPPGPVAINLAAIGHFEAHPGQAAVLLNSASGFGADVSTLPIPSHPEWAKWMEAPPEVKGEAQWAALTGVAWLVVALAVVPAIFVYHIGALLSDARDGLAAAAFYLVVPAIGFFEPWFDLVYPIFTAAGVWMFAKGLTGSRMWFFGAGLTLGAGLFFSYCQVAALGILGGWALAETWRRGREAKRLAPLSALWVAAGLVAAWGGVLAITGHDLVRQFPREVATTWKVGAWTGEAMPHYARPYFTWLFANLVEFFCFHGLPLSIGLVWAGGGGVKRLRAKEATAADTLAVGLLAAVLLLDLTGATRSEVGRLWMFFMPAGAVAAMRAFPSGLGPRLLLFAAVVAQGLIFKLTLTTNNFVN